MKLSLHTVILGRPLSFEELLALAQKLGYEGVDAGFDAAMGEGAKQTFGTIHESVLRDEESGDASPINSGPFHFTFSSGSRRSSRKNAESCARPDRPDFRYTETECCRTVRSLFSWSAAISLCP